MLLAEPHTDLIGLFNDTIHLACRQAAHSPPNAHAADVCECHPE